MPIIVFKNSILDYLKINIKSHGIYQSKSHVISTGPQQSLCSRSPFAFPPVSKMGTITQPLMLDQKRMENPSSHWDPGIHLPDQTEKTSNRTSAPHLRSMTIIFMLMCKIFQILESPHTPYAGVTARRQERLFFSSGNSTGPGLKWQGIVMEVSRIANTSIITGQKRRRFSIFILPKSCSNSRSKQVPQGISEHTETFIGMGFSPSSVHSQAPKKCKSVYY